MLVTVPRIRKGQLVKRQITAILRRTPDALLLGIQNERGKVAAYVVEEFETDGGRGFALTKTDGEVYSCLVAASHRECRCSCWGALRHGACKHLWALREMCEGRLEAGA